MKYVMRKITKFYKVVNKWKTASDETVKMVIPAKWRRSGAFIVNLEQVSHLFLVFLLVSYFEFSCFKKYLQNIISKFINFEQVSYLFAVFILLALNK